MKTQNSPSDEHVNAYRDDQYWAGAMLKSLVKSLLFAGVFTLATTTLFQGFWLWISLGGLIAIILPLCHLLKIQSEKDAFKELTQITDVLPEALGNQILKGVINSALDCNTTFSDKPLKSHISQEILGILRDNQIIPDIIDSAPKRVEDVYQLLRKHAKQRIVRFDTECIENDDDYADLLHQHFAVTQDQLAITDISSTLDVETQKSIIDFNYADTEVHWEFKQTSDWVSDAFFTGLGQFVRENSDSEFLIFPAEDQCAELIFLPKVVADFFKLHRMLNPI